MFSTITHLEVPVTNVARAKRFYGKLFALKFITIDTGYVIFKPAKGVGGAFVLVPKIGRGDTFVPYFEVKSIERTLLLARKMRVKVRVPYTSIADYGFMAQIYDSEGNVIGLHES